MYSLNTGALAWFLTCILLWIFGFPYYIYKRSKYSPAQVLTAPFPQGTPPPLPTGVQPPPPGPVDSSDQLRQMKKLLDEGVITADDFERKKKALLGL